jgi:hypothetical protein
MVIDPEIKSDSPTFQIDPQRSPFFRVLQPQAGTDVWKEVGFVWTMGTSRTSSVEYWYLYNTVPTGSSLAPYTWPGYDASGRIFGANLRLVPATPPSGQTQYTLSHMLTVEKGVTLTSLSAQMAPLSDPNVP